MTAKDKADALELARHDYAHVLAEAVQHLFPGTQITFGPSTDDGFYYDFAPAERPFTEDDLPAIEAEMRRIIARNEPLVREEWPRDRLVDHFAAHGETFKAEWAAELPDGEPLTVYSAGAGADAWLDLCRGPHLASTGKLDPQAFKLTRVSGAYWRGDQNNAMLSRIYGTGWLNRKQLDEHLVRVEEAAKRDHRKLGRGDGPVPPPGRGAGSVFWHPNGFVLWRALEAYMRRRLDAGGYAEVKTPQLMDARQWEAIGHWGKYRENMFVVPDEVPGTDVDGADPERQGRPDGAEADELPGARPDLPPGDQATATCRCGMAEFGCCHRNEPHGALHGIMRVRQFTQDDAHIFCREDQIVEEVRRVLRPARRRLHATLASTKYAIKLALRPDKRFGSEEMWDWAEQSLRDAVARGRARHARVWLGGAAGRGRVLRAQARVPPDRRDRADVAGRHDPDRYRPARAARRELCRRGRRAPPPGDAAPRDPRARSSASSAS